MRHVHRNACPRFQLLQRGIVARKPGEEDARAVHLTPAASAPVPAIATLDEAMAEHVRRALAATRGRTEWPTGAAALLGINPHTLRVRMRTLSVERARFRG